MPILIATFVGFDAVIPIFPSESLLTTASTAASGDDSTLTLWLIVFAGGLGALVGDSLLYWLSRTVGRGVFSRPLEKAQKSEKATAALSVLGDTAPLLIIVGRFVPGVRFVVNASMGIARYPYRKFLLFSTIGSFTWSAYTCIFSYLISEALSGYPVLSIATSVLITTGLLAVLYIPLKRRYERAKEEDGPPDADDDGGQEFATGQ